MKGLHPSTAVFLLWALVPTQCESAPPTRRNSDGIPYSYDSISLSKKAIHHSSPNLSKRWYGEDNTLYGPYGGNAVVGDIRIGTQTFTVRFDTGSADIWVAAENITCTNGSHEAVNTSTPDAILDTVLHSCQFKHDGYNPVQNPNYTPLSSPNNFLIVYAAGAAAGIGATDDISVGQLTVPNQTFGIVNQSTTLPAWGGTADGIFGLAGASLTSIYKGSNLSENVYDPSGLYQYTTWFDNAWRSGSVAPYVSFWIKKPSNEQASQMLDISDYGTLTLGGISPDAPPSQKTLTVPNVEYPMVGSAGTRYNITWWTAAVDDFVFPGSDFVPKNDSAPFLCIFDSAQSGVSIPPLALEAFHDRIEPRPIRNETSGHYYAKCDAKVPDLGLKMGDVILSIPGEDLLLDTLILDDYVPNLPNGYCLSLVGPSITNDSRLFMGDPFFWSHIVTKDYEKGELTFSEIPSDVDRGATRRSVDWGS